MAVMKSVIGRISTFCTVAAGLGALFPAAVHAQVDDLGDAVVEEIVVTGSRLVRRDFNSPSPITTIDRGDILSAGQPTLEEALNTLPQMQPSFGRTSNNPGDGTSKVDLRGIGPGRTLVMLNGRRIAPAGIGSAIDVNALPSVLVQRVEIITGGATAVYGADAIAGVVNVITRDDFEGFGLETSYYTTERGDADTFDVNLTWGRELGAGHLTLFGAFLDRDPLFQADRRHSAQTINDDWFSNTLGPGGSPTTPAGAMNFPRVDFGNGPARTTWDDAGNPREFVSPDDLYDFAPINYLQVPLRRMSGGMLLRHDVGGRVELYSELTYTHNEVVQALAPAGSFGAFVAVNTDNPVLTPANQQFLADNAVPLGPNLVGLSFQRRFVELGPRIADSEKKFTRLLTGLRGDLNATWEFDVWASYTKVDELELQRNDGSFSRLQQGLLVDPATSNCFDPANGCVPLNLFGAGNLSAEGAEFLRNDPYQNKVTREQSLLSAFIRGAPFTLPAGGLATAIGVEWRRDSGGYAADDRLFSGDTLGFRADSNVVGAETVTEIYAEMLVPIVADAPFAQYLGLELGGRLSSYDHAGELQTWKLGTEWEPVGGVRFRAMLQRSARAPNLAEAFQLPYQANTGLVQFDSREDPCSASADPVGNGFRDVCIAQGIPAGEIGVYEATLRSPVVATRGGNPDLAPEIAETLTAGIVFSLFESWTLAVDYFEIDVEDTIGQARPWVVCWDPANTSRAGCDRIGRDPVTYDTNTLDQRAGNLGNISTRGFDTQLSFGTELSGPLALGAGNADLDVRVVWTHVKENSIQADVASTSLECVGKFGFLCRNFGNDSVFPENRVTTNLTLSASDWRAQLSWQWIDGSDNSAREVGPLFGIPSDFIDPAVESVGAKSYVDLSLRYDVSEHVTLGLTIANLFDEDPAFFANNGPAANTDPEMYDVFGRAYTLRLALNY